MSVRGRGGAVEALRAICLEASSSDVNKSSLSELDCSMNSSLSSSDPEIYNSLIVCGELVYVI